MSTSSTHSTSTGEISTSSTKETPQQLQAFSVLLGPMPYNRFLGNPPAGKTAEEAFEDEMGYPWMVTLNLQSLRDKVNKLEAQITQLQAEVKKDQAQLFNQQIKQHG